MDKTKQKLKGMMMMIAKLPSVDCNPINNDARPTLSSAYLLSSSVAAAAGAAIYAWGCKTAHLLLLLLLLLLFVCLHLGMLNTQ